MLIGVALQEIWQRRRGAVEEVRPRQRLEYRPCTEAPHVERRIDEHPRIYRRH